MSGWMDIACLFPISKQSLLGLKCKNFSELQYVIIIILINRKGVLHDEVRTHETKQTQEKFRSK